jgi:hypothetical protein
VWVLVTGSALCMSSVFSAAGDNPGATESTSPATPATTGLPSDVPPIGA